MYGIAPQTKVPNLNIINAYFFDLVLFHIPYLRVTCQPPK